MTTSSFLISFQYPKKHELRIFSWADKTVIAALKNEDVLLAIGGRYLVRSENGHLIVITNHISKILLYRSLVGRAIIGLPEVFRYLGICGQWNDSHCHAFEVKEYRRFEKAPQTIRVIQQKIDALRKREKHQQNWAETCIALHGDPFIKGINLHHALGYLATAFAPASQLADSLDPAEDNFCYDQVGDTKQIVWVDPLAAGAWEQSLLFYEPLITLTEPVQ